MDCLASDSSRYSVSRGHKAPFRAAVGARNIYMSLHLALSIVPIALSPNFTIRPPLTARRGWPWHL